MMYVLKKFDLVAGKPRKPCHTGKKSGRSVSVLQSWACNVGKMLSSADRVAYFAFWLNGALCQTSSALYMLDNSMTNTQIQDDSIIVMQNLYICHACRPSPSSSTTRTSSPCEKLSSPIGEVGVMLGFSS